MTALMPMLLCLLGPVAADQARIDGILERLEARGQTVYDLKCQVRYTIEDTLADDKYTKIGEIRYKRKEPNPIFWIHFEKMSQEGVWNKKKEWYIFDGRYVWEIKEAAKNKIQHEVVRPGETIDLFDIEQSPIPIPFGQKKAQIQKNFAVVLIDPAEGDPPNTDHLVCQPKPDSTLADEYERLEFFVSKSLNLPVRIISVQKGGTRINSADFPELSDKSINTNLPESALDIPKEARSWKTVTAEPGTPLPQG